MDSITRYYDAGSDYPDKAWVKVEGRDTAISVDLDGRTDAELIADVQGYWENADVMAAREAGLRSRYPDYQVFGGFLPSHDVNWDGEPGWYEYVLRPRRKGGKYQVLAVA